jgi:hypothetical protein
MRGRWQRFGQAPRPKAHPLAETEKDGSFTGHGITDPVGRRHRTGPKSQGAVAIDVNQTTLLDLNGRPLRELA